MFTSQLASEQEDCCAGSAGETHRRRQIEITERYDARETTLDGAHRLEREVIASNLAEIEELAARGRYGSTIARAGGLFHSSRFAISGRSKIMPPRGIKKFANYYNDIRSAKSPRRG